MKTISSSSLFAITIAISSIILFSGCTKSDTSNIIVPTPTPTEVTYYDSTTATQKMETTKIDDAVLSDSSQNEPIDFKGKAVKMTTPEGDIYIKFYADKTPKTVENFITHAQNGYYNGVIFHRVIPGFMVQGGDPLGNGTGGESIWGGSFEDEFDTTLSNTKGTIAMANSGPATNGSQFFINDADNSFLDGRHTVFGEVYEGMDVVEKIINAKRDGQDMPLTKITMDLEVIDEPK